MSASHIPSTRRPHLYTTIPDTQSLTHPAGRHPTLATLEDHLHRVTLAAAAAAIEPCTAPAAIVALPTVVWMRGPADHPKARRGLLPHPINWSVHPLLQIPAGERLEVSWSVRMWGTRLSGTLELAADSEVGTRAMTVVEAGEVLATRLRPLAVPAIRPDHVQRLLRNAAEDGSIARWRLHEFLEPWLRRSMMSAHRAVSAELRVPRVLDDIALEDLFTELLLGVDGRPGLVAKAVNRLATPSLARPNVDAARYIVTTFRRDAELALRRRIDDPRWVGAALRRFAANHPELSGRELVDAYNDSSCTSERIGLDRAMRALHPAVQPTMVHVPVESMASRSEASPDEVFLVPLHASGQRPTTGASSSAPDATPLSA